jgi:integrase
VHPKLDLSSKQAILIKTKQHVRGDFLLVSAVQWPGRQATVTLATYMEMFLSTADREANSKETYVRRLILHVIPYIGRQRVAEVSRETIHRLLTVVLKEEGASQTTILHTRTALSAMLQIACDNGYRKDKPSPGIKLKGVPAKPIIVATKDQFLRVYNGLPHQPAKVLARLGVSSGAWLCELISFIPEDFDFDADMLAVRRSTVEVTAKYHPSGDRFLTREYTKNGEHRRFKVDHAVSEMVREHIALHGIGPGQVIFPVRLFASTEAVGRDRLTQDEMDAMGFTGELPNGRRYKHGTLGGYVTAKCRCRGQWSSGLCARPQAPPDRTVGAGLPFRYTPYQVRHTRASWLIDQGVDLARVQYRLGHGDLQATTRYVKILDEEDPKAADVISAILGDVA